MSWRRQRRSFRLRVLRVKIAIHDAFHLIATENRLRIPLLLLVAIFGVWTALQRVQLGDVPKAVTQTTLSVAEVMLGIYLSVELYGGLRPPAKDRIDRPETVVDFYEDRGCADEFIRLSDLSSGVASNDPPDVAPGVVESVPDAPVPTTALSVEASDTYYPLPERVERLYEPVLDTLHEQFVDEGSFNQIKLRPRSYDDGEFEMGSTTFFNNYATNLNPDAALFEHRTPRELLHPLVFDSSDRLRPLTDTDLPYIAASAGMVIAKNGEAIFPVRSRDVVIEGMNLGLSFGGSWDYDIVARDGVHEQIASELDDERGIPADMDVSVWYLGTMRRLELLGKPDCFLVAICDGIPDWAGTSREERESVVARLVPEGVTVDGIDDLIDHRDAVTERLFELLQDSPFHASPGLLYWIYLLNAASPEDVPRNEATVRDVQS